MANTARSTGAQHREAVIKASKFTAKWTGFGLAVAGKYIAGLAAGDAKPKAKAK